jgi:hypothetical protein
MASAVLAAKLLHLPGKPAGVAKNLSYLGTSHAFSARS